MRVFVAFFILLGLMSCSGEKNGMDFGFNECYKLEGGDQQIPVNQAVEDEFEKFQYIGEYQVLLNRSVKNPQYRTYIGIAMGVETGPDLLYDVISDESNVYKLEAKENLKGELPNYSVLQKKDSLYNFVYIYNTVEPHLNFVFNYIGEDSATIAKLYHDDTFPSTKFNCD